MLSTACPYVHPVQNSWNIIRRVVVFFTAYPGINFTNQLEYY